MARAFLRRIARAAAAAAFVAPLACGGNPVQPSSSSQFALVRVDVTRASAGALTVEPGGSLQLKATAVDAAGRQRDVTASAVWQSSDPKTALASSNGLVKAGQTGNVEISATLDGVTGKAAVEVKSLPADCAAATLSSTGKSVSPFNNAVGAGVTTPHSDCRWIAVSDASWLNPGNWGLDDAPQGDLYDPGRGGDGAFIFTATANRTLSPRTGHINVSFTDGTAFVYTVNQAAPTCAVSLSASERVVPFAAASGSFAVHVEPASCAWSAWIDPGIDPSWNLHVSGGGTGDGTITYSVNPTPHSTSSEIFFLYAKPSNPADPPIAFRLRLYGPP